MPGMVQTNRALDRWKQDYLRRWKALLTLQGEFARVLGGLYDRLPVYQAFLALWVVRWRLSLAGRSVRHLRPPAGVTPEERQIIAGAMDDLAAGIRSWNGAVTYLLTFLEQAAAGPALTAEDLHSHLTAARAYMEQASARFACGLDAVNRIGCTFKLAG